MKLRYLFIAAPVALALACGGSSPQSSTSGSEGAVNVLITDAPSEAWADIGVIIRSVALVPVGQSVSAAVQVYDGSKDTQQFNLAQMDNLAELLNTATVKAGTYDRVIIKVDGNPANVTLAPSLDANGNPQNPIPTSQIVVNGTRDANGWVTVPTITLRANLQVVSGQPTAVQLDFDLASPLFVVTHDLPNGTTFYVLNFVVRHKPHGTLDRLILRQHEGQVTGVASDGSSMTVHTLHGADLTLFADNVNDTLFYNLDQSTVTVNPSKTIPSDLVKNDWVKVTARFQDDGSLWLVRVWYSADESKLPTYTPEGHVVRVNTANGTLTVLNDQGRPVVIGVDASTEYFFQGGTQPIGQGTSFLANLARNFKVAVTSDPLSNPHLAKEIDIQHAVYGGDFLSANATQFAYDQVLWGAQVIETVSYDPSFSWWNFAYPGDAVSSANDPGHSEFIAKATASSTDLVAHGESTLTWSSGGANPWSAVNAIFLPAEISILAQKVSTAYANGTMTVHYNYFRPDGTQVPTDLVVNLDTTTGSQPIVAEYTRFTNGVTVTFLPLSEWGAKLTVGTVVRVYGTPKGDGTLDAYVVNIFD